MSVLKSKRKASQFEVFHHLNKLRRDITDLLLRDFGYSFEKAQARLEKRLGGRCYSELTDFEKDMYNRLKQRWDAFDEWFIEDQRKVIVDCLREITKEVYIANSIYPTCYSDNKFKGAISNSASNFANVNDRGSADCNGASKALGVRPAFSVK